MIVRLISMNAPWIKINATMGFVKTFLAHINATAVQALAVNIAGPTFKNVCRIHVLTVELAKMISTLLNVYVLQALKVCDDPAPSKTAGIGSLASFFKTIL